MRYRQYRKRKAAREGRVVRELRDLPPGTHFCPKCEQVKSREDFPRNRSSKDGLAAYCKPCHNQTTRETKQRLYGSTRDYHLRHRYGLTSADVDAMIEAQGGTCATCDGKPEHVDHDHATGKVRGVLCFNCNQALGNVRDNAETLTRLRSYLRQSQPTVDAIATPSPIELDLRAYFDRHQAG
jgi:hypothetical protein